MQRGSSLPTLLATSRLLVPLPYTLNTKPRTLGCKSFNPSSLGPISHTPDSVCQFFDRSPPTLTPSAKKTQLPSDPLHPNPAAGATSATAKTARALSYCSRCLKNNSKDPCNSAVQSIRAAYIFSWWLPRPLFNSTPHTPTPKPHTPIPDPQTLNPLPNPKPPTLNPQSEP